MTDDVPAMLRAYEEKRKTRRAERAAAAAAASAAATPLSSLRKNGWGARFSNGWDSGEVLPRHVG